MDALRFVLWTNELRDLASLGRLLFYPSVETDLRGARTRPLEIQLVNYLVFEKVAFEDLEKTLRSRW